MYSSLSPATILQILQRSEILSKEDKKILHSPLRYLTVCITISPDASQAS